MQDVRNVAAIARASLELLQLRALSDGERERIAVMHLRSLDRLERLVTEDERCSYVLSRVDSMLCAAGWMEAGQG